MLEREHSNKARNAPLTFLNTETAFDDLSYNAHFQLPFLNMVFIAGSA